jgi:hypothetical protein
VLVAALVKAIKTMVALYQLLHGLSLVSSHQPTMPQYK